MDGKPALKFGSVKCLIYCQDASSNRLGRNEVNTKDNT